MVFGSIRPVAWALAELALRRGHAATAFAAANVQRSLVAHGRRTALRHESARLLVESDTHTIRLGRDRPAAARDCVKKWFETRIGSPSAPRSATGISRTTRKSTRPPDTFMRHNAPVPD